MRLVLIHQHFCHCEESLLGQCLMGGGSDYRSGSCAASWGQHSNVNWALRDDRLEVVIEAALVMLFTSLSKSPLLHSRFVARVVVQNFTSQSLCKKCKLMYLLTIHFYLSLWLFKEEKINLLCWDIRPWIAEIAACLHVSGPWPSRFVHLSWKLAC